MTIQIGDTVGDYKVIGIAGSGGMGAVYKIEHVITKRIEAMKLLPPNLSTEPEQVQRFEREIQVQARLHHPHIVALYNAIRHGRSIALIMEFVEGESLQRVLEAGPLPLRTAVDYTRQVLSALAYAHEHGVIHRDVGPANIIITLDGTAKLSDFGLARAETDLRLTSSGVAVGSPWYMSPEQVRGLGVIDGRTDIYAVGAILHEMLTGAKLFEADGQFAVMRAQVEAVPPVPSARNASVPPMIDAIVARALAKDPAQRFQTASEFLQALETAIPDCPPMVAPQHIPPPSVSQRSQPWSSHLPFTPRQAVWASAVPAVLLAAFVAVRQFPATSHAAPAKTIVATPVPAPAPVSVPAVAPTSLPEPVAAIPAMTPAPVVPAAAAAAAPKPVQAAARVAKSPAPARTNAIRVTGAEVMPAAPVHSPVPAATAPPVSASPSVEPSPEPVAAPQPTAAAPSAGAAPGPALSPAQTTPAAEPSGPDAASPGAKVDKPSNRLVRALGRINPFKKTAKEEPQPKHN